MGAFIYPRIENTEADWVHRISGKALSRAMGKLSKLVKKQGFKDLLDYYVEDQEELDAEGINRKVEIKWFNPMEGLLLIEAMTRAFEEHRDEFERQDHLAEDLKAFRSILERAASEGLRWNLGISA